MPTVIITLTDTPTGAVSIKSSFTPAIGHPVSFAQAVALDIINRTHKQWGVQDDMPALISACAPALRGNP